MRRHTDDRSVDGCGPRRRHHRRHLCCSLRADRVRIEVRAGEPGRRHCASDVDCDGRWTDRDHQLGTLAACGQLVDRPQPGCSRALRGGRATTLCHPSDVVARSHERRSNTHPHRPGVQNGDGSHDSSPTRWHPSSFDVVFHRSIIGRSLEAQPAILPGCSTR